MIEAGGGRATMFAANVGWTGPGFEVLLFFHPIPELVRIMQSCAGVY